MIADCIMPVGAIILATIGLFLEDKRYIFGILSMILAGLPGILCLMEIVSQVSKGAIGNIATNYESISKVILVAFIITSVINILGIVKEKMYFRDKDEGYIGTKIKRR